LPETTAIGEGFMALSIRSVLAAFVLGGALAGTLAGCTSTSQTATTTSAKFSRADWKILPQYKRQVVAYQTTELPGTIIVDTASRHLYLVEGGGKAIRYGIGVGRQGFAWSGTATIKRKVEWPRWTPPAAMVARQPELAKYAGGMPGGIDNPLGARALYLYQGDRDTLYRLHGTNEPWSIGKAVSSGCIRLLNEDIVDIYNRAPAGTRVVVL
jgi:lipoprotein-anchoring transpeptidase ErfK/SrfK